MSFPDPWVSLFTSADFEEPIPDDRYHGIYFAMLLAGVGFLLPYNSFITDVDYLHQKFKGMNMHEGVSVWVNVCFTSAVFSETSIVFDMNLMYIVVALVAVILNNVYVERLSMHTRITVGKEDQEPENRKSTKICLNKEMFCNIFCEISSQALIFWL